MQKGVKDFIFFPPLHRYTKVWWVLLCFIPFVFSFALLLKTPAFLWEQSENLVNRRQSVGPALQILQSNGLHLHPEPGQTRTQSQQPAAGPASEPRRQKSTQPKPACRERRAHRCRAGGQRTALTMQGLPRHSREQRAAGRPCSPALRGAGRRPAPQGPPESA